MSNPNSIADVILLQNQGKPLTLAATTTIHQSFAIGGAAAILSIPNPMTPIDTADNHFPARSASGLSFLMRAAGMVTGGEKYQIDICQGSGLTNVIASTGLSTNGLTADNWLLECECMWDATSLFLRGIYWGWAGAVQVAQAALITSVQPAALANLTFNVAVTVPTANANALFTLTDFSADLS